MRDLPRAARIYVGAVILTGTLALALRLATDPFTLDPVFLVLIPLAVALGSRTVDLGQKAEMALSLPLILCALMAVGPGAALDVAAAGMLSTCLLRRKPFAVHRTLFNVASIVVVTFISGRVYGALVGGDEGFTPSVYLVPLLCAVIAYFVTNTSLVAGVIALSTRKSFFEVWSRSFRWTLISYLAGGSIAAGMVHLLQRFGPYSLVLAVPPILLIYYFFRLYTDRAAERRKRIEEIERHNARLESEVARRTQELVEQGERLRLSNRELERANRLKSEFLANMSHELRTPLNAIIGFSELLRENTVGPLNGPQLEYVDDIHAAGRHLLELINDILDLSKIEAGRMAVHREECDLPVILRETLTVMRPLALKKRLQLVTLAEPATSVIVVDAGKLKQIIYNLVSNAVKFTGEGGVITIEARAAERDLVIAVSDTGMGIPAEDLDRIFDEFYQVDGSYTRRHEGTGLGLALVRRLVAMHGGTVEATSRVGEGSVFRLRLPGAVASGEAPAREPSTQAAREPGVAAATGGLVMVVEDNPINMRLTRSVLASHGFEVLEAPSGEDALRLMRSRRPDLILMDLQLPGMDGLTLTRLIKSDPSTAGIPTIALTACAMKGDELEARAAGCAGYITKPVSAAELARQLNEHLTAKAR